MVQDYDTVRRALRAGPRRWLVTGAAGFIGSHLVEALLALDQEVVGLDNFETGFRRNLAEATAIATSAQAARFRFYEGDIRDLATCALAARGCDFVLHQAALGSVPRSLADPIASNAANVGGFLNMLVAARDAGVRRFVYAASSSTYGDRPDLPKIEDRIGRPLSPYAVTKRTNELYADVFADVYGLVSVGLRYFNVFGPRQDPDGAYAAVIPKWIAAMLAGRPILVNGDGETSRDFCFVANAVQANLLAAVSERITGHEVFNVAVGERTTLNELATTIRELLGTDAMPSRVVHGAPRPGDVRHSQADIGKARARLGYAPTHRLSDGLAASIAWNRERSAMALGDAR